MVNQNTESLRTQIIDSMKAYCDKYKFYTLNEQMMFDEAIMPVLDAAMKAGELLVHRATTPQRPVDEAVLIFLYNMCASIAKVRVQEETVSRRELLNILYHLDESAGRAAADANTTRRKAGNPLDGLTLPKKG